MNFIKSVVFILLSTQVLSGCSLSGSLPVQINPQLVAEPLQVDYENEVRILRLNRLINSAEFTPEQRARLLYDRASVYERLGLRSMARFDYDYAIKLKPDFAEAYSAIGVHLIMGQQFDRAYEAFDSANDLNPNYQYAYLSRAIALYYGRSSLAIKDIETYLAFEPNDPYRVIWHYIVQMDYDPQLALENLRKHAMKVPDNSWASNIIKLYLGQIKEHSFIQTLADTSLTLQQKAYRQCEAYFYLGKLRSFQGDAFSATYFYKLALATNVFDFIEHKYARLELDINKAR